MTLSVRSSISRLLQQSLVQDKKMENLIKNVVVASFATVGLIETLKNFIKTDKKWVYALIMVPMSVGCFAVCVLCPSWVIGGLLTVGVTQLCYQTIVQTFNSIVKNVSAKLGDKKATE